MNEQNAAVVCRALSDSNRLKIVRILTRGERCACKLLDELEITQPTLSHHMKILAGCELVRIRCEGKWSYYSLNCATLTAFREYIGSLVCENDRPEECCR